VADRKQLLGAVAQLRANGLRLDEYLAPPQLAQRRQRQPDMAALRKLRVPAWWVFGELRYVQNGVVQRVHSPATIKKLAAFLHQRASAPAGPATERCLPIPSDATPTRDQTPSSPSPAPSPAPSPVKASKLASTASAAAVVAH
jgi:hypothetical protein